MATMTASANPWSKTGDRGAECDAWPDVEAEREPAARTECDTAEVGMDFIYVNYVQLC